MEQPATDEACSSISAPEAAVVPSSSEEPALPSAADDSVIAAKYASGEWVHAKGQPVPERYPTNREVAEAVEQLVSASVETYRNYRGVAWYTLFIGLYLLTLYSQAASFRAGDVVATLKAALLPDSGSPRMAFSGPDQVLAYLGNKFVQPVYDDPVCGNGRCEVSWEGPAWGPFGCQADCGLHPNTTKVVVALNADFNGHPSISAAALRAQVAWNVCLRDDLRQMRGLPPLCWYQQDQVFESSVESHIRALTLLDGGWFIRLDGDLAGRVTGAVYDASGGDTELVPIPLSVGSVYTGTPWEACKVKRRRAPAASGGGGATTRRLLAEFTLARRLASDAGEQLMQAAVQEALAPAAGAAGAA